MSEELKIILYIVLISIAILYILLFLQVALKRKEYIIVNAGSSVKNKPQLNSIPELSSFKNAYQTDFFRKSIQHAEKVLYGKTFIEQYGEQGYYANELLDIISKINNETKKSIVLAMQYITLEPVSARIIEKEYRAIAEKEKVPLWFIILKEGTRKIVPSFFSQQPPKEVIEQTKIIPLFGKVA